MTFATACACAQPHDVVAMLLRQALGVIGVGVGVGLAAGVSAAQLVRGQLHGVSPMDPSVLVAVAVAVMSVGALAAYIPAHRGAKTDPMVALRSE